MKKTIQLGIAAAMIAVFTCSSHKLSAQWSLTGNAGTNSATNFIGTTDNQDFKIKTNNGERLFVGASGFIGIGTNTSINNSKFGIGVSGVLNNAGMYINSTPFNIGGVTYTTRPTYGYAIGGVSKAYHAIDASGKWRLNINSADRLIVSDVGKVGVGVANPSKMLDVAGDGAFSGDLDVNGSISGGFANFNGLASNGSFTINGTYPQKFTVNIEADFKQGLNVDYSLTANKIEGVTDNTQAGVTGAAVYNHPSFVSFGVFGSNNLSPNSFGVACQGNGYYTGSWYQWSDKKLKTNVTGISNALSLINELNPSKYNYDLTNFKSYGLPEGTQLGFIAQEVEKVIPELVKETKQAVDVTKPDGESITVKMVNYIGLIPVLTKAIQEQQEIIEKQNERINKLEATLTIETKTDLSNVEKKMVNKIISIQPNPTNKVATIQYNLADDVSGSIIIRDIKGVEKKIVPLKTNGFNEIMLSANDLQAGVYTCELIVNHTITDSKKIVIQK